MLKITGNHPHLLPNAVQDQAPDYPEWTGRPEPSDATQDTNDADQDLIEKCRQLDDTRRFSGFYVVESGQKPALLSTKKAIVQQLVNFADRKKNVGNRQIGLRKITDEVHELNERIFPAELRNNVDLSLLVGKKRNITLISRSKTSFYTSQLKTLTEDADDSDTSESEDESASSGEEEESESDDGDYGKTHADDEDGAFDESNDAAIL